MCLAAASLFVPKVGSEFSGNSWELSWSSAFSTLTTPLNRPALSVQEPGSRVIQPPFKVAGRGDDPENRLILSPIWSSGCWAGSLAGAKNARPHAHSPRRHPLSPVFAGVPLQAGLTPCRSARSSYLRLDDSLVPTILRLPALRTKKSLRISSHLPPLRKHAIPSAARPFSMSCAPCRLVDHTEQSGSDP